MALYVVSSGVLSLSFIFHHSPFFYPPLQIFFISKIAIWPNPSQEKKRILKIYATIKLLLYNHHLCTFLSFLLGDNFQSQILKRGMRKNMSAWGDLKSSWNRYLPRGADNVPCQSRPCKMKSGFEGSVSNVDLSLCKGSNQLMFSFVTFWFC